MPHALVDCEGLVHIYKTADLEVVALQGLDLEVGPGELIAIQGRSGSGKTTLMNILAGLEPPTAGAASVDGHDLTRLAGREREQYRQRVVGYVRQHAMANLSRRLTAAENVQVPILEGGRRRAGRAADLLNGLGLGDAAKRFPSQLSGGQRQRLALAVSLANEPRLLLADEPTAELDSESASALLRDLSGVLRSTGTSAVMVTHDTQLERFVDRVVQIRDGRTSTERRWVEQAGELVHDEVLIMDRAGRIQLPRAYVEKLGLKGRVRAHLEDGGVWIRDVND
jgi:putative ABC transport system ATP-binding protein